MKLHASFSAIALSLLFTGCCVYQENEQPITQLQIREIQTREFDTQDTKLVMKSVMNVLQDEGFIVKNAVMDIGLLNAEKHVDIENKFSSFCLTLMEGKDARWCKQTVLEASANVSEFGCKTRVRMNFQSKTFDNFGCPKEITTIQDPQFYMNFFDKVSKGIFIQEQNI